MKRLYILYDATCGVCRRCRVWLDRQRTFVPLAFVPLQSPDLERRFPGIGALHPEQEIVVVSDGGEVWQGGSAWVMCLWALEDYREWAQRLASPVLLPLARRACALLSDYRHDVSRWLESDTDPVLAHNLATHPEPVCGPADGYCKPR